MKKATKAEREYLSMVSLLPCSISNSDCAGRIEVHHKTDCGRRIVHFDTMPLCSAHHRNGGYGIAFHAGKRTWEENYGTQDFHIQRTRKLCAENGVQIPYPNEL